MVQVFGNMTLNTETAQYIGVTLIDDHGHVIGEEALYYDEEAKQFFLHVSKGYEYIVPLEDFEAESWAVNHLDDETIEECFEEVER